MKRILLSTLICVSASLAVNANQLTSPLIPSYDQVQLEQNALLSDNKPAINVQIAAQHKGQYGTLLDNIAANGRYVFSYANQSSFVVLTTYDEQAMSWQEAKEIDLKTLFPDEDYDAVEITQAAVNEDGLLVIFMVRRNDGSSAESFISIIRQQDNGQLVLLTDEKLALYNSFTQLTVSGNMVAFRDYSNIYLKKIDATDFSLMDIDPINLDTLGLNSVDQIELDSQNKRLFVAGNAYSYNSLKNKSFVEYSYSVVNNSITLQEQNSKVIADNSNWESTQIYFDKQYKSYLLMNDVEVSIYQFVDGQYTQSDRLTKADYDSAIGYSYNYNNIFYDGKLYTSTYNAQVRVITIENSVASISQINNLREENVNNAYLLKSTAYGLVGVYPNVGLMALTIENTQGLLSKDMLSKNDKINNVLYVNYLQNIDLWVEVIRNKINFYQLNEGELILIDSLSSDLFFNDNYNDFYNYRFSYDDKTNKLFYFSLGWYGDYSLQSAEFSLVDNKVTLVKSSFAINNANGEGISFESLAFDTNSRLLVAWNYNEINFFKMTDTGNEFLTSMQDGVSNIDYLEQIRFAFVKDNYIYVLAEGDSALTIFEVKDNDDVVIVSVVQDTDAFASIKNAMLLDDKIIIDGNYQVATFSIKDPRTATLLSWSAKRDRLKFIDNHYALDINQNYQNPGLSFFNLDNTTGYMQNIGSLENLGEFDNLNRFTWFPTKNGIWMTQPTNNYDNRLGVRALITLNRSPLVKKDHFELVINEGEGFSESLSSWFIEHDLDDTLRFSSDDINNNFMINDEGMLVLSDNIVAGTGDFSITATDKQDNTSIAKVNFDLNAKPYLFNVFEQFNYITDTNIAIDFKNYFTDEQRETLSFTIDNIPDGLLLNDVGLLSGAIATVGSYSITVVVTDHKNATTQESLTLVVSAPAPVVTEKKSSGGALFYSVILLMLISIRRKLIVKL